MARDTDGINIRKWASQAGALVESIITAGVPSRAEGFDAPFGADEFFSLEAWNQLLRELTGFLVDVAQHGVLEWTADQEYAHPSIVLASDGLLYRSVQAGGQAQNPATDASDTFWRLAFTGTAAATAAEIGTGAITNKYVSPARLLAALFGQTIDARWQAGDTEYGLMKRASAAEANSRSGEGVVIASRLPASSAAPNSTTLVRGIIRTATAAETRTGTATSPAVTPAGVKAAIDQAGLATSLLVDAQVLAANTLVTLTASADLRVSGSLIWLSGTATARTTKSGTQ